MMTGMMKKKRVIWPALAGYLAGLATAGVVAMLLPSTPDSYSVAPPAVAPPAATPSAATQSQAAAPAPADAAVPQHASAPLSDEARARATPLRERLAADPGDLLARKQLALVLLQDQQLMPAYEHGSQILAAHPDDPDGLYVHGVVRLAMGHAPHAIELLDRVLARYPDHALALKARAEAQRKIGDEGGAALTEERARQATRSDGSEVDQLLAAASDGSLLEMMRSSPPAAPPAEGPSDDG